MHRALLSVVLPLSILLSTLVAAQDASYTFTTIDVPGAGNTTHAFGINAAGQIVGEFFGVPATSGFVTDGATFTPIDPPGTTGTRAFGINTAGQIVGWFGDAVAGAHGFVATPDGADTVPPLITISANPATLSPPNGRLVAVTVSGTMMDKSNGSGVQAGSAAYQVMDEYGQIQPNGSVTLVYGRYAFTVQLEASRRGNDQDGRRYTIIVSATDHAGNGANASATVTVPRK